MGSRWLVAGACVLALGVGLTAEPALAAAKNKNLVKAKKAYDDLDYTRAQSLLQKALKGPTTHEEQIELYELQATLHAIYGRDDLARAAFLELLKRKPDAELPPDTSPKIRSALAEARTAWEAEGSPVITPAAAAAETSPRAETAEPEDADDSAASPAPAPVAPGTTTIVEPVNPLMVDATSYARPEPIYTRWWFWTLVGAAIAGGGAAVWYLTEPRIPAHDLGPIPVR